MRRTVRDSREAALFARRTRARENSPRPIFSASKQAADLPTQDAVAACACRLKFPETRILLSQFSKYGDWESAEQAGGFQLQRMRVRGLQGRNAVASAKFRPRTALQWIPKLPNCGHAPGSCSRDRSGPGGKRRRSLLLRGGASRFFPGLRKLRQGRAGNWKTGYSIIRQVTPWGSSSVATLT